MSDSKRKNRIFLVISIAMIVLGVALSIACYRTPLLRTWHAFVDFLKSIWLLCKFIGKGIVFALTGSEPVLSSPMSTLLDTAPYDAYIDLQISFDNILSIFEYFASIITDKNMFLSYNIFLLKLISMLCNVGMMFLLPMVCSYLIIRMITLKKNDNKAGSKSTGYLYFEKILLVFKRIILMILDFVFYFFNRKIFVILLVSLFVLDFSLLTFVFDFFSFYFSFCVTQEGFLFFSLIHRLLIDVLITFRGAPVWFWFVVGVGVYYYCQHRKALNLLRHNEAKNCGFIKTLEYCILIIGEPGKGKTTLLVDMVMSLVNIFKQQSLDTLYKYELMFPAFSFSVFRAKLDPIIAENGIWCMPCIDDIVKDMFKKHEDGDKDALFGFNLNLHNMSRNVGNCDVELFDALATYGKAYVIYMNSNPSISNVPIAFDGEFDDSKHLKLWNGDFFKKREKKRYSHIYDRDMVRFGKKVNPDSPRIGAFGWGIYSETETAKSWGNKDTNAANKIDDDEANPLNDLHEMSKMLLRHANSTVDNINYNYNLSDEQRAVSLAARDRELCSILNIDNKSELMLAIKGYDWLFKLRKKCEPFKEFFFEYSNLRSDMILLFMFPKFIVSGINLWCMYLENVYGYRELMISKLKGDSFSGNSPTAVAAVQHTYYLANMKIYSDRFVTDCYSFYFTEQQKACGVGIDDIPTFKSLIKDSEEMALESDYMIIKLNNVRYETSSKKSNKKTKNEYKINIFAQDI